MESFRLSPPATKLVRKEESTLLCFFNDRVRSLRPNSGVNKLSGLMTRGDVEL